MTHHELMTPGPPGHAADLRPRRADHRRGARAGRSARSFQRALLCDIRIAAEDARFMLPEVDLRRDPRHRRRRPPVPDVRARRRQRHGPHRPADERRRGLRARHRFARGRANDELDDTAWEMAREDRRRARGHGEDGAAASSSTWPSRRSVRSMAEELIAQTFINKSDDMAELRAARAEEREPRYTGS